MNASSIRQMKATVLRAAGVVAALVGFCGAAVSAAQETCPCPPPAPPPPLWTGSAGLSYLATSGNTDTRSLGLTAIFARKPTPWGLEVTALANQAETDGVKTADRTVGGLRVKRALDERFELFGGASYARDRFAGFDSRVLAEAGGIYKALLGPRHTLAFDAGLTWTQEEPVLGSTARWVGAVAGLAYVWQISATAALRERLGFYPNFEKTKDWRFGSETALEATLAASWAVRVGYLYAYDNLPPAGFEKTDGTTSVSLVWKR